MKALNLPEPKYEKTVKIYQTLPRILQWRIMVSAYQRLNENDKELFRRYFEKQEGYDIQLLFYQKIPNYKQIIDEELEKLRKEVLEIVYGQHF